MVQIDGSGNHQLKKSGALMVLGDLVKITWLDAHGSAANVAYEIEEIPHAAIKVVTYGILLKDDEVGVSIANEVCDTSVFRGYSFVPRVLVVKMEPVKTSRKPKKHESVPNDPDPSQSPPRP